MRMQTPNPRWVILHSSTTETRPLTYSDGKKYRSLELHKRSANKVKKANRQLSRKQHGRNNRKRARKHYVQTHRKIVRQREDHQLTNWTFVGKRYIHSRCFCSLMLSNALADRQTFRLAMVSDLTTEQTNTDRSETVKTLKIYWTAYHVLFVSG